MDNVLMPNCVYEYIEGQYKGLKIRCRIKTKFVS